MKKALLIFIPAIVIILALAQIDDDLSKDAASLIDRVETDGVSEAYLYLLGFFADENDNPIDIGRNRLEENRRLEADDSYEIVEYQDANKIPLPRGEFFCRAWEDGCLEFLFSSEVDSESLLTEHKVLVYRSNKFLEFQEYKTLAKPAISEQFPPYQYINAAERIKVLDAISTYKNGNPEEAIESLLSQLSKLRKSFELQDNLIGKLFFLMKLSEIIDVSSVILSEEGIKTEILPGLSQSEKSFHMVAAREFGMSYYTFKNLDKHPDFFEIGANFADWILRMVYKPNMTINAITPIYYRIERLALLSPSDFANEIESGNKINPSTSKLRNYVGGVLIAIPTNFDEYVARVTDFDVKLALFNQMHHSDNEFTNVDNPYYEGDAAREIDGNVCLNGPFEDKRFLRCLRIKIK